MTPGTPLASQATSDSFPISSPSFWQAAVQVDTDTAAAAAAAAAAVVSARPPKRSVHFSDEVPEKKARLENSLQRTGIPASSLDVNDFWASDDEEDAAGRRSEQAAKEYLMNPEYAPNKFGDIGDYIRKKEIKM
jgi:DNA repair protein REV1